MKQQTGRPSILSLYEIRNDKTPDNSFPTSFLPGQIFTGKEETGNESFLSCWCVRTRSAESPGTICHTNRKAPDLNQQTVNS